MNVERDTEAGVEGYNPLNQHNPRFQERGRGGCVMTLLILPSRAIAPMYRGYGP
ncbi:MAG: hypothetical protein P9M10_08595 [Candidatus Euphemobacter frigidus]|nr:hypothetical protein [Candidatus Euphemobacter frigidus]